MDSTLFRVICERWKYDYIACKNPMAFGEYDFDYDDFSSLMQQSYYFLKEIFDSYNLSVADLHNSNSDFLFAYAEIVSLIKSYGTTEIFQDFPEEYLTTMLIAKKFAENCCTPHSTLDSVLSFCMGFAEEDNIKYDIEKGDFSDIIEHAYDFCDYLMY